MKNTITKISAALSFCIVILLMMGCPGKKQGELSSQTQSADSAHIAAQKDSSALRLKALLKDYINRFSTKLTSYNDTLNFLDSIVAIEAPFFDCNMSNPTLKAHVLDYNAAFAYIMHFQNMYKILACAEIPLTNINALRVIKNPDPKAATSCGVLLYLGIDGSNNFSIAYHNEANVGSDPSRLFPRTNTAYDYFKADCQNTNRTAIPDPNDLDIEVTRYAKVCSWTSPTGTYTNDEITRNGFALIAQLAVLQPPIAFFHSQEVADLISQNDGAADPSCHCTGIRFYYGYDEDPLNPIKIKLIAYAIDGNGNNIIYKYDGSPAMMLERSWPPD